MSVSVSDCVLLELRLRVACFTPRISAARAMRPAVESRVDGAMPVWGNTDCRAMAVQSEREMRTMQARTPGHYAPWLLEPFSRIARNPTMFLRSRKEVVMTTTRDLIDTATTGDRVTPRTHGVDHIGLSVRDLETTVKFFCECLEWRVVGRREEYPAAFVSDGWVVLTLWQVENPNRAVAFDRRANVGLHHLALAVVDRASLEALYERISQWPGVIVEFGPQTSGRGAKMHFIICEPGGLRLEFAFVPQDWAKGI
jgi:catechol 2,3-dioxygenase-like lactoylglutathione lyase family enzyme